MSAEHERVQALFDALCDLPAAEQERRLAAEGSDADVREEVRRMLAADRAPLPLLESAVDQRLEALVDRALGAAREVAQPPLPERIGSYRVLGLLGVGGMGAVYEAEQESPRRRVALKVLRPGFGSGESRARFAREGRVLGQLKHPGIAQVHEVGSWDSPGGPQPFLAMELIEGLPLDEYAAARRLELNARLELLIAVCAAVQHAHEKGVLHRDLKPSNVLVTPDGRPVVLDFGVARVVDPELTITQATHTGELVGTLRCMSPEQARGTTEELDARSDVYALGVLLYELLSGAAPYALEHTPLHEAARIILEEEPTRLGLLDRRLAGDLETIVGKALEKERERRYASAEELAADLRRHLSDQPIVARPPSARYRFEKFARRNRALVTAIASVLVVAIVAALVSTLLYLDSQQNLARARFAEDEWRAAARTAERKALLAGRVRAFLENLFEVSDPSGERGAQVRARDLLERGRERIDLDLADEPGVRGALILTMGRVYKNLAEYRTAIPLLEESVALLREAEGRGEGDPVALATALFDLGEAHHYLKELVATRAPYEEALALRRANLPLDDPELARSLDILARLERDVGAIDRAQELGQEALELRRANPATTPMDLSDSLQTLSSVAMYQGRTEEAERLIDQAIGLRRSAGREGEWRVPQLLHARALLLRDRGLLDQAEQAAREAYEGTLAVFGPGHRFVVNAAESWASVLSRLGQHERAIALIEEAGALLDEDDSRRPLVLNALAGVLGDQGLHEDALDVYREGIEIMQARPDVFLRELPILRSNLAMSLLDLGRAEEARDLLLQVVSAHREIDAGRGVHLGISLSNLAMAESRLGQHEAARAAALEAVEIVEGQYGVGAPPWTGAVDGLGTVLAAGGWSEEAAEWRARLADATQR